MYLSLLDIMPSVNDVLCILIIPLLDYLVYPHIEKTMRFKLVPLHKVLLHIIFSLYNKLSSYILVCTCIHFL